MQYVNDDMDELFRRAAKDYPLDTNSSDWNKVAAALVDSEGAPAPVKKKRSFLGLLMLIPLSMICHLYISPDNIEMKNGGKGTHSSGNKTALASAAATIEPGSTADIQNTLPVSVNLTSHNSEIKNGHYIKYGLSKRKAAFSRRNSDGHQHPGFSTRRD